MTTLVDAARRPKAVEAWWAMADSGKANVAAQAPRYRAAAAAAAAAADVAPDQRHTSDD